MKHRTIQNRLLLYLDGEIPEEHEEIRHHLSTCEECREVHNALANLWHGEAQDTRVSPPPYLWDRIQARLEAERRPKMWWRLQEPVRLVVRPVGAALVLLLAVFAGVRLAQQFIPAPDSGITEFREEFRMDYFSTIPSGSVGEFYVVQTTPESEQ